MSIVETLVDLLRLEQLEHNLYRGQSRDIGTKDVFGGQVLAQALSAAIHTVEPDRIVHSLHAYFILPGDVQAPIVYQVDRIRDGRSFATRRVVALQHGRAIFFMSSSFQVPEEGASHQMPMPKVKMPDEIPSLKELFKEPPKGLPEVLRRYFSEEQPVEFRPVSLDNPFAPVPREPFNHVWFRITDRVSDDQALHRILLAYASDFNLLGTAMRPHALSAAQPGVKLASLDHALWFHRPLRADEWLLYALDSPSASEARGFCRGSVFSEAGELVASVAQEGLMRVSDPKQKEHNPQ
ncbi:MAG: acyl-CoA thioesterase II [Bacteroidetes bacterium]|nr:acyl-CoA thioesterase II [Bacteroidota bacterium]